MDENYQGDETEYDFRLNADKVSTEQIQVLYQFACNLNYRTDLYLYVSSRSCLIC